MTQNLLDGQQRLTVFWRAVHNNYEWETFFVYLPQFDQSEEVGGEVGVRCVPRWINKNNLRMPRWAEEPSKCCERGLIAIALLRPGDLTKEIDSWLNAATATREPAETDSDAFNKYKAYAALKERIKGEITTLRERVTHFNLPYLSLPADTSKDVALQVFINMNTNSQPLSLYEIIVAEVESVVGSSLHDLQATLNEHCPTAAHYADLSDLILSTSALLQDKTPNARGEIEMDKADMVKNWKRLEHGLDRMAKLLAGQGVFDEARLPTNAVLPVIAACYESIPENGDFLGKGEKLLRQYLWSSFFTDRYENTAASRAYADFKALKTLLLKQSYAEDELVSVPALNRKEFALADIDALLGTGWPKHVGIAARGILAVTTYLGALDFADNKPASFESNQNREYHHIFPDALLADAKIDSYLALNCAFITWKTNRIIGHRAQELKYQEQVGKTNAKLNSDEARKRADGLQARLEKRMEELKLERQISALPPVILGGFLVVPMGLLAAMTGHLMTSVTSVADKLAAAARAREAVIEIERKLGFEPLDREHEKLGYDIESRVPHTGKLRFIEVKGRITSADTITVTKNEILYSLNKPEDFILAIVEFCEGGTHRTHYLRRPFQREPDFGVTSVNYDMEELIKRAEIPS